MAPQVLVNVDHSMDVMMDESFGPVIGIMKVTSDEEAVKLMNDSPFGLTASIWTNDEEAAIRVGDQWVFFLLLLFLLFLRLRFPFADTCLFFFFFFFFLFLAGLKLALGS